MRGRDPHRRVCTRPQVRTHLGGVLHARQANERLQEHGDILLRVAVVEKQAGLCAVHDARQPLRLQQHKRIELQNCRAELGGGGVLVLGLWER